MLLRTLLVLPLIFVLNYSKAQLTQEQRTQINEMFEAWNAPNHPGGTVGIMQDGELIFSEAYGLASLEYLVPNTTETLFNIASVSKQFTAMGIVLLEQQGKLSLSDPITKHLPDLPEFASKITIAHMLHHTSGFRSLHAMLGMAGWRGDDMRTNEDLYRFVLQQKELNFEPGDEYLYCNTGFILAGLIIEKITQQDLPSWSKENIFEPLGMYHTYLEDKPNRVVKQNATSYDLNDGVFDREVEYWGYTGSGNIHATTRDLLVWAKNFYSPKQGWEKAFERMELLEKFNSGAHNKYALGINVDTFREGIKRVYHGGSIGGFRSILCTFPDQKLSVAIVTNFSRGNPGGYLYKIADLFLPEDNSTSKEIPQKVAYPDNAALETLTGAYWDATHKNTRYMFVQNDTLFYGTSSQNGTALLPLEKDKYKLASSTTTISFTGNGNFKYTLANGVTHEYQKYAPVKSEDMKPIDYLGEYYSPELQTTYHFKEKEGKLVAYQSRHGELSLSPIKKDTFRGSYPLGVIEVERGKRNKITGFRASNGRVRNLLFEKK